MTIIVNRIEGVACTVQKPNYKTTFKCDCCKTIIYKARTVFTKTSYGGTSWLCVACARRQGINKEPGVE